MLLDGKVIAAVERSCPKTVQLPEVLVFFSQVTVLEIVVHAMGRNSGGCDWDFKGLPYPNIQLNGASPHPCAFAYCSCPASCSEMKLAGHNVGRNSGGCDWDFKGLAQPDIQLNGVHSHRNASSSL